MKIALVTDFFMTGGGLEHIYQIASNMPDIEFGVFGKDGHGKDKFHKLSNVKIFSNGYSKNIVKTFDPDIVHIHSLRPLIKLYNTGIKTIFTIHGIHLHKYEFLQGIKPKILKKIRFNLEKFLYNKVDKIITVSDDDKEFIKKYYNLDSTLIYNCIDYLPIAKIDISKEKLRKKLSFSLDKKIYLTVARFDFQKGYDILLDAVKILRDSRKIEDKLFIFVGNGYLFNEIKKQVSKYNLNDHIIFLGNRNDVYEIMKASDCFVLPSRWEGFSIALIEAMACNLPIVASDTYGNRCLKKLENDITLFRVCEPLDLSKKIIDYKNANYSTLFTIEKMIQSLRSAYESIYNR